jgi:hypothetical protein
VQDEEEVAKEDFWCVAPPGVAVGHTLCVYMMMCFTGRVSVSATGATGRWQAVSRSIHKQAPARRHARVQHAVFGCEIPATISTGSCLRNGAGIIRVGPAMDSNKCGSLTAGMGERDSSKLTFLSSKLTFLSSKLTFLRAWVSETVIASRFGPLISFRLPASVPHAKCMLAEQFRCSMVLSCDKWLSLWQECFSLP